MGTSPPFKCQDAAAAGSLSSQNIDAQISFVEPGKREQKCPANNVQQIHAGCQMRTFSLCKRFLCTGSMLDH